MKWKLSRNNYTALSWDSLVYFFLGVCEFLYLIIIEPRVIKSEETIWSFAVTLEYRFRRLLWKRPLHKQFSRQQWCCPCDWRLSSCFHDFNIITYHKHNEIPPHSSECSRSEFFVSWPRNIGILSIDPKTRRQSSILESPRRKHLDEFRRRSSKQTSLFNQLNGSWNLYE